MERSFSLHIFQRLGPKSQIPIGDSRIVRVCLCDLRVPVSYHSDLAGVALKNVTPLFLEAGAGCSLRMRLSRAQAQRACEKKKDSFVHLLAPPSVQSTGVFVSRLR